MISRCLGRDPELTAIYIQRGIETELAKEAVNQLMAHSPLRFPASNLRVAASAALNAVRSAALLGPAAAGRYGPITVIPSDKSESLEICADGRLLGPCRW